MVAKKFNPNRPEVRWERLFAVAIIAVIAAAPADERQLTAQVVVAGVSDDDECEDEVVPAKPLPDGRPAFTTWAANQMLNTFTGVDADAPVRSRLQLLLKRRLFTVDSV